MGLSADIGVDLGTATVLIFVKGKGIVLNEPSVVAIDQDKKKVLAVGELAQKMLGRTPGNISAIRPLKEGVIADFEITEVMLKHFLLKVGKKRRLFRPRVVVCIPANTTSVEKKAVIEALSHTGAREAYLIEEPRAAALGAGLDIFKPGGNMIIDIGGGTTDIAVLSLGDTVVSTNVKVGGDRFDEAILRYMKKEFRLLVGERSAEELKIKVGSAIPGNRSEKMEIRGRDTTDGLPRSVEIKTEHIAEAISEPLTNLLQGVRQVLERTPPELSGDIIERGIVLTGGGALLDGLPEMITREVDVPTYLPEDPVGCVAQGTGVALEHIDQLSGTLVSSKAVAQ